MFSPFVFCLRSAHVRESSAVEKMIQLHGRRGDTVAQDAQKLQWN
jgi:hypothetical protein